MTIYTDVDSDITTPDLPTGTYTVTVEDSGGRFIPQTYTVSVQSGQTVTVNSTLQRKTGTLTLTQSGSSDPATYLITTADGTTLSGTHPGTTLTLTVPSGVTSIQVSRNNFQTFTQQVTVAYQGTSTVTFSLNKTPYSGTLSWTLRQFSPSGSTLIPPGNTLLVLNSATGWSPSNPLPNSGVIGSAGSGSLTLGEGSYDVTVRANTSYYQDLAATFSVPRQGTVNQSWVVSRKRCTVVLTNVPSGASTVFQVANPGSYSAVLNVLDVMDVSSTSTSRTYSVNVHPGLQVVVSKPGFTTRTIAVNAVTHGATYTVDVTLTQSTQRSLTFQTLHGATLYVYGDSGHSQLLSTLTNGQTFVDTSGRSAFYFRSVINGITAQTSLTGTPAISSYRISTNYTPGTSSTSYEWVWTSNNWDQGGDCGGSGSYDGRGSCGSSNVGAVAATCGPNLLGGVSYNYYRCTASSSSSPASASLSVVLL